MLPAYTTLLQNFVYCHKDKNSSGVLRRYDGTQNFLLTLIEEFKQEVSMRVHRSNEKGEL